jgi:hypothetical protein
MTEPAPAATPEPKAAEPKAEPQTFTQDDVTRIVQERLARDRKDRPSEDELKTLREAADRLTELENANKSELEKAQAAADKAAKERDEALNVGKAAATRRSQCRSRRSSCSRFRSRNRPFPHGGLTPVSPTPLRAVP